MDGAVPQEACCGGIKAQHAGTALYLLVLTLLIALCTPERIPPRCQTLLFSPFLRSRGGKCFTLPCSALKVALGQWPWK